MQTNILNKIKEYRSGKLTLVDILKYLSSIPYDKRDRLCMQLYDLLQLSDLMYEDYKEGFIALDKPSFDIEIKEMLRTK